MFTFNFSGSKENEAKEKNDEIQLHWFAAKKIEIQSKLLKGNFEKFEFVENSRYPDFSLKLVDSNSLVTKLTEENCELIIEAESQHSDLVTAKYEGGLKIWECTYDLADYILREKISLTNCKVLDLGCGAGIIGIIAILNGSKAHFQDYNIEVIESYTMPNVIVNCKDVGSIQEKCEFYSGDWQSFVDLMSYIDEDEKYDFIFTSETIYNSDNHEKLYQVFKNCLKRDGTGFVAGKSYYFGVGGNMRQFEEKVSRDDIFDIKQVWKNNTGLLREILKLERKR